MSREEMQIPDSHAIKAFEKHLWQLKLNSTENQWNEGGTKHDAHFLLILLNILAAAFCTSCN